MDVALVTKKLMSDDARANFVVARRILTQLYQQGCPSKVLPTVLTYLSSVDPVCKKLAYWLLLSNVANSGVSDGFLLAANTFGKECSIANPAARAMAVRALSYAGRCSPELSVKSAQQALRDSHPHVRRSGVIAHGLLYQEGILLKEHIVDGLYAKLGDTDPIVQCLTLQILEDILNEEGGVVISKKLASHLLNSVSNIPDWMLGDFIGILSKFEPPPNHELCYEIMNVLDPYLQSPSPSVCLNTIDYFLKLSPDLKSQILTRALMPVLVFIGLDAPEITTFMLDKIAALYLESHQDLLRPHYEIFFSKQLEPFYVKKKKMHILGGLADDNLIDKILKELSDLVTREPRHGSTVLQTCSTIGEKMELKNKVIDAVISLLTLQRLALTGEVLCCLMKLGLPEDLSEQNISLLLSGVQSILNQTESDNAQFGETCVAHINAALWCIGECPLFTNRALILKDFLVNFSKWSTTILANAALLASIKAFCTQPAQGQGVLGLAFEQIFKGGSNESKHLAKYYYYALKEDIQKTKKTLEQERLS